MMRKRTREIYEVRLASDSDLTPERLLLKIHSLPEENGPRFYIPLTARHLANGVDSLTAEVILESLGVIVAYSKRGTTVQINLSSITNKGMSTASVTHVITVGTQPIIGSTTGIQRLLVHMLRDLKIQRNKHRH